MNPLTPFAQQSPPGQPCGIGLSASAPNFTSLAAGQAVTGAASSRGRSIRTRSINPRATRPIFAAADEPAADRGRCRRRLSHCPNQWRNGFDGDVIRIALARIPGANMFVVLSGIAPSFPELPPTIPGAVRFGGVKPS